MKAKKIIIITVSVIGALIILLGATVGGYVEYVAIQYYRIDDMQSLTVEGEANAKVRAGDEYSVLTYNLGFGAYSPEYSFFMDTGVMKDGTKVTGKYAKGINKEDVQKNVDGQINTSKAQNADFYLFQEVDEKADRSYNINMRELGKSAFDGYSSAYAENFHTANLLYPFNDPIGKSRAGIMTYSKYSADSAIRRSFPITKNFIDKLFDLDRCFSITYLPIEGKTSFLALVNIHMSAYDEGGTIRAKQLEMMNTVLSEEYEKGNYVVAGGDFNHCLIADNFESDEAAFEYFASEQQVPDWVKSSVLHQSELEAGLKLVSSMNASTCRGADIPYTAGVNFTTVIDGFIVSENVDVSGCETVDTEYAYSDHNPVKMSFKLR